MLLNSSKTVVLNICFSNRQGMDIDVCHNDNTFISPSDHTKFLGVIIDSKLTFSEHIQSVLSKCYSRLHLLKQLKCMNMDTNGLKTFYIANVRSILSYASPVWFHFLANADKLLLEKIQRYATRIILPHITLYHERLSLLSMPLIEEFLMSLCSKHFIKISSDNTHPLFNKIMFNNQRKSTRNARKFYPSKCRTAKRQKSFFEFYMRFF